MLKKTIVLFLLILIISGCSVSTEKAINLTDVRTEMYVNPEGVSSLHPRFSWKLTSNKTDVVQTAYQIEVASSEKDLKEGVSLVWNSGKVQSDKSILLSYDGPDLKSGQKYYWRVSVWTNTGDEGKSDVQYWSMALLNDLDWKAKWIGLNDNENLKVVDNRTILPARYLRKEFKSEAKPIRATLYVSGLGSSTCYINGKTVGNDVFGPLPTWYDASAPYLTYDVTSLVNKGENAIGVALGNGRYLTMRERGMEGFGLPRLLAQLNIEYDNGETTTIVSDESWMATNKGPITENNEFDGEKYDARLELGSWTEKGYDASTWQKAEIMEAPKGKLTAQLSPSLKVMEEIKPLSVKSVGEGRYIVDMGQNMVGLQQVKLYGKKDQPISMRFAEVLKDNGTELYLDNMRGALVTDVYTPAKDGQFTWEPLFVYHGFRFIEISGLEKEPTVADFVGKVVYDEMSTIGSFESSEEVLNKIHKNAYWGIRGNYRGMPTDCPQRDERLGWLGDRTTGAYGESFIFDNALLYNKWLVDIEESMNENGSISVVSPRYWTIWHDDVTWPAAYFYVADMLYQQFGDDTSIKKRYPTMKRWVNHMVDNYMVDGVMPRDTYGDWCMPPESPELIHSVDPSRKTAGPVLGTTVFYSILQLMEKFANMNGYPEDAKEFASIAATMKEEYNKKYFNAETAQYDNNTVTANMLSLQLGLVPDGYEEKVFANIVEKTEGDCKGHVSAGVLGIQHLMRGLTEHGNLELAYKIATNETYPSWGYMIKNGATTIWELWNGDTADPAMNSRNHVMLLGDLLIWFYEDLAGIKNDPSSVGFKKILMEPVFPEKLNHVNAHYDSPYGRIESSWKRDGDKLSWSITIPVNTTATVKLPSKFKVKLATDQPGVHSVNEVDNVLTVKLGSGKYTLQSE
ncbi:glycoside hydrolase family 78 protein [Dysgonomonas sp. Marseille-P4361]|uniref:glycoside hydrolase family 78 protein n=1 Tax=Dysgonomonas sp. Marseille-P4361 TaxID=2161820 RepID=UPI000D5529A8|nr:glycoside hydrolase family 78 protein [Dysgonomonas sp. Marseille-P4361]